MTAKRCRPVSALFLVFTSLAFASAAFAQTQCWAPREVQDTATNPKWAPQLQAMAEAEKIVRATPAFLDTPEPVRMRTTVAAGPYDPAGARLLIRAYPEKSTVGIQIWTGKCEVIPQAERVAASIGQIDVFFNYPVTDTFLRDGEIPKRTGEVAGYPEYNHWIVITKNGRLPWIPQTLAERLDRIGVQREKDLVEWRKDLAGMKAPNETDIRKTYDMFKKSDPASAEGYRVSMQDLVADAKHQREVVAPATTASLEKAVADYKQYRASFSADVLQQPAVWADVSGDAKRKLETRIQELQALSSSEQQEYDRLTQESRALDRQARAADKTSKDEAQGLRDRSNALALQAKALRNTHQEQATSKIQAARDEFDLFNLKPGAADKALGFKPDPNFPDPKSPTRIQLIAVMVPTVDTRNGRDAWSKRTKSTLDYAALARLLD
ncbi:MAG TPA: hypothetical protein VGN07_06715 [Steroidobacteraceae bacterium]